MSKQVRAALAVAVALLIILGVVQWRMLGPAPKASNAPANEFSAVRALEAERATIGGKVPHPVGSAANHAVRERIVAHLEALGYDANVQRSFACNAHNTCATVENIIARLPGQLSGPSVLLCAHYDSVFAGPGASDDGTGVASLLEIARVVRTEKTRNPVTFLIDDGEEAGLLGAEAFVADRGAVEPIAAVINIEARGTSGPSVMFETSTNNRWFVPIVAHALPSPNTTSLYYSIYELLPNDTDLTVFKRAGLTGVNFGYVKNVVFYHTPFDDIDHVGMRSLQHHGDNALASLRALANTELRRKSNSDEVWFDVLGFFVVAWPAKWTMLFAIASLVLAIIAASILVREQEATAREIAIGIGAFLAAILAPAVIGFAVMKILPRAKWIASPQALVALGWIIGIFVALAVIAFARKRARFDAVFVAIAIVWNILALIVTIVITGASYGFLVPGLALAIATTLIATGNGNETALSVICAVVAAIIWFPFGVTLYDALGHDAIIVIALLLGLVTTTFAALFDRISRAVALLAIVSCVVCIVVTMSLPTATNERPRGLTVSYLDDGTRTQWIATSSLPNMQPQRMFDWYAVMPQYYAASAPKLVIAPVVVTRDGNSIHVVSQRGGDRISLAIHARVPSLRVNGVVPPPRSARFRSYIAEGWTRVYTFGSEMTVDVGSASAVDVVAMDYSSGLPPEGRDIAALRAAAHAVPSDSGDATITMVRTKL